MSSIRHFVFYDDKLTNCQKCSSCCKLLLFHHCSSFYCFVARGHCFCCLFYNCTLKGFQAIHVRPYESCYMTWNRSRWLFDASHKLYIFMCLSGYWQWKLTNERGRISVLIVKTFFLFVTDYQALTVYDHAAWLKSRNNQLSDKTLHVVSNKIVNVKFNSSS